MKSRATLKRILIWSASYAPVEGGLQRIVADLALGLQKKGYVVHVLTNRLPSSLASNEAIEGIPVTRYRFFHVIRPVRTFKEGLLALYGLLIFPIRLIQLIMIFHQLRPDVVNIQFPGQQIWFLGILQRCFRKSKWIISLHGDEILQFFDMNSTGSPSLIKKILTISERIKLKVLKYRLTHSNGITTCSAYLMTMTSKLFKAGINHGQIVYNGIDYSLFTYPMARLVNQDYIFACGRLTYTKGFDLLIYAYAKLPEHIKHSYRLIIAGSGVEKDNLVMQAIQLEVHGRIHFYGSTTQQETAALLQHSKLTVVPSRRETFGIVMLEAMAASACVLATNVGGIPEIAKYGNASLCDPTADSIAGEMIKILSGKCEVGKCVKATLENHFSREIMLNKYESLLFA